jgi:hypothetical protein
VKSVKSVAFLLFFFYEFSCLLQGRRVPPPL